ncbi:MAG: TonB-dependent receptor [Melioribacteraceae bacterium]|nr:TonB-dependent receptor [Melioribacteraceae bacterium]
MRKIFLSILISAVSAQVIFSQNSDTLSFKMDSVIVSATRYDQPLNSIPFSLDVIKADELLLTQNSFSTIDLLASVPGIYVSDRNNLSQGDRISIRGMGNRAQFGVRGSKILLDGIPLTFADGQSQLNNLELNNIEKVEIIRGPSSSLYGNSSGGVILFTSKISNKKKFTFEPAYKTGSDGFRNINLNVHGVAGKSFLSLMLNSKKYDGFRDHSAGESYSINFISKTKFRDEWAINSILNFYDAPYLLNPSSLTKEDALNRPTFVRDFVKKQAAGKEVRQGQAGITLTRKRENSNFNFTIFGASRSMFNPIPGRIIKLNRLAGGIRTTFSSSFLVGKKTVNYTTGFDYEFQNDVRTEFENDGINDADYANVDPSEIIRNVRIGEAVLDQKESVESYGAFVNFDYDPSPRINLIAGMRVDNFLFEATDKYLSDLSDDSGEREMNSVSGMLGVIYKLNITDHFFANFSTSFQTPTTNELSNREDNLGGFNPTLKPENILSTEIGFRGYSDKLDAFFTAAIYYLQIDNIMLPFQSTLNSSDEVFYKNAARAGNFGIELSTDVNITSKLLFGSAYTFSNFRFISYFTDGNDLKGNKIPGIPDHKVHFDLRYNSSFGLSLLFNVSWNGEYFTDDFNGSNSTSEADKNNFINDSYTAANFTFLYKYVMSFSDIIINMSINNILNERYNSSITPNSFGNRFFEPGRDRNYIFGVQIFL